MDNRKVAVITGGSSNIGLACVQKFSKEFEVLIADILKPEQLELTRNQHFFTCDITNEDSCKELFVKAKSLGDIHVFVNSAGITSEAKSIENTPLSEWQRILNVNLNGTFIVSRASIPYLRQTKGSMVLISSRAGRTGFAAMGTNAQLTKAHYCASKAGVISLVKSLALELAECGVRVNGVAPGPIEGTMIPEEKWQEIAAKVPLKRIGKPKDIAEAVYYLCGPTASFITGHTLDVNGGTLMS
ncbi:MAG: SDR family oxidoreductase [Desulfobulbaceae bacterium]|nr:SDR family oxidoreductase [Desulfobulbaceae bacterium]